MKYNLLIKNQYGFRPKFSSEMALLNLTENVNKAIDRGQVVVVVTLDLLKAFDMVPIDVLIEKLTLFGFSEDAIRWFVNYTSVKENNQLL